jgi:hypothetical protein
MTFSSRLAFFPEGKHQISIWLLVYDAKLLRHTYAYTYIYRHIYTCMSEMLRNTQCRVITEGVFATYKNQ